MNVGFCLPQGERLAAPQSYPFSERRNGKATLIARLPLLRKGVTSLNATGEKADLSGEVCSHAAQAPGWSYCEVSNKECEVSN